MIRKILMALKVKKLYDLEVFVIQASVLDLDITGGNGLEANCISNKTFEIISLISMEIINRIQTLSRF